jgi:hypothetical protein
MGMAGFATRAQGGSISAVRSDAKLINKPKRKAFTMKKTGRIELAREIIARVKREMQESRLTASVRKGMHGKAALDSPVIRLEKM